MVCLCFYGDNIASLLRKVLEEVGRPSLYYLLQLIVVNYCCLFPTSLCRVLVFSSASARLPPPPPPSSPPSHLRQDILTPHTASHLTCEVQLNKTASHLTPLILTHALPHACSGLLSSHLSHSPSALLLLVALLVQVVAGRRVRAWSPLGRGGSRDALPL